jgi:hypothetical protein
MYNLNYLAYLVYMKNEVNKRRRRFRALGNPGYKCFVSQDNTVHWFKNQMHPAYSVMDCKRGYEKAKRDMKALSPEIRRVCKALGAKLTWDAGHYIWSIRVSDEQVYYRPQIENMAVDHHIDTMILDAIQRKVA